MVNNKEYHEIFSILSNSYHDHKTLPYPFRLHQLKQLLRLYEENNDQILEALRKDMSKSKLEGYLYEVDLMKNDVREAIRNLKRWMSDTKITKNLLTPMDEAYIVKEPLGIVLVIGPWNYPFQLTLVPLCGAIAAGNCVIIKPSEVAVNSALTMAELVPKYLDQSCYRVVLGGPLETQSLLDEKFNHIFYTGNFSVAREIHAKAGKHLITTTFELGGKSPCYIDSTVNYKMAAKRILWGKCMNLGQTCVAPDYILCTKEVESEFLKAAKEAMKEWYGNDWKGCQDLARIINKRHFLRLKELIDEAVAGGARVAMGGAMDEEDLWIQPTIVVDVKESSKIMQDEIFGPVLAVFTVGGEEEALEFVKGRPHKPLCLYVFTSSAQTQKRFQLETSSGTMAFNDTIVQFAIDELPFGGIGESGHGTYHGKFSFNTFSHEKPVVLRDFSWVGEKVGNFRYPPYSVVKINFLSFMLHHWKKFKFVYLDFVSQYVCIFLGFLFGLWWAGGYF